MNYTIIWINMQGEDFRKLTSVLVFHAVAFFCLLEVIFAGAQKPTTDIQLLVINGNPQLSMMLKMMKFGFCEARPGEGVQFQKPVEDLFDIYYTSDSLAWTNKLKLQLHSQR
ncbi:hypothetical protein BDR04DRAFT_1123649 [Suillus decipiens]|nr:hypothetical protein BDR04DRAFT_1123649 [Suillus decipiens]